MLGSKRVSHKSAMDQVAQLRREISDREAKISAIEAAAQSQAVFEQVLVRVLPDGRMSRDDAARYLGHKSKTLAMWKLQGKGPRSVLVGGKRFYFRADLDAFIEGG